MDIDVFLKESYKYRLGDITTEMPHPKTVNLSSLANEDLDRALSILQDVDLDALKELKKYSHKIEELRNDVKLTLESGGRVFLCGCGATGRLSLLIEFLWREAHPQSDQVFSLMAGGDVALVHSLEGFEDFPEYGERHLKEMGFKENDLLISSTEGGETPYVIGATEAATTISKRSPYFLYCNPDEILKTRVERSKRVIENEKIKKIELFVGPMALSGSTRMQASTVLQLSVGMALLEKRSIESSLQEFIDAVEKTSFLKLKPFVEKEASLYKEGNYLMYVPYDYAISVFTDTTERSPTFSLPAFEKNNYQGKDPSLCYIMIPEIEDSKEAWEKLLNHKPRPLNWSDIEKQTLESYLYEFDFSLHAEKSRMARIKNVRHIKFVIKNEKECIHFDLDGVCESFPIKGFSSLYQHTLLKLLLNTHSTLLMGRLGRYKSNIMTWVAPTNGKLIDRSARYVQSLLKEKNIEKTYEEVVRMIFKNRVSRKDGEPIVLKTFESFLKDSK